MVSEQERYRGNGTSQQNAKPASITGIGKMGTRRPFCRAGAEYDEVRSHSIRIRRRACLWHATDLDLMLDSLPSATFRIPLKSVGGRPEGILRTCPS